MFGVDVQSTFCLFIGCTLVSLNLKFGVEDVKSVAPVTIAGIKMGVNFLQQYKFVLLFLALLVFCSVMVIRQLRASDKKHVEIREAFVLLHTKGYTNEAQKLYHRLLRDLDALPNEDLIHDFQRTLLLIDPATYQPSNLIYNYHWTVSKELERRSESTLMRALELAKEEE